MSSSQGRNDVSRPSDSIRFRESFEGSVAARIASTIQRRCSKAAVFFALSKSPGILSMPLVNYMDQETGMGKKQDEHTCNKQLTDERVFRHERKRKRFESQIVYGLTCSVVVKALARDTSRIGLSCSSEGYVSTVLCQWSWVHRIPYQLLDTGASSKGPSNSIALRCRTRHDVVKGVWQ